MDVGGDPRRALSAEGLSILREGIFLVLSCWWGLQMALYNYSKAVHKLGYDIVSWFTLSKGPPYIDDLEAILDELFLKSLITYVEDGSIEEVAYKLMVMHEECLEGKFQSIERLRETNQQKAAVHHVRQPKIMRSGLVVDDPLTSRVAVVSATVWHNMEKVDQ